MFKSRRTSWENKKIANLTTKDKWGKLLNFKRVIKTKRNGKRCTLKKIKTEKELRK